MAVTATLLTAGSDTAAVSAYNTASVAPAADRLLLVAVMPSRNPSGDFAEETVTGLGLTWTQVATTGLLQDTSPRRRVTWWRASTAGATPTPGAITIGYGTAPNSIIWSVLEVAGHDPAAPIVQTKPAIALAATSVSATFDTAPAAGNAVLAAVGIYNQEAIAPAAGYAELTDTPVGGPNGQMETAWATGAATASGTWTSASVAAGVLAVEVKAAGGGGPTPISGALSATLSVGMAAALTGTLLVTGGVDTALPPVALDTNLTGQAPAAGGVATSLPTPGLAVVLTGQAPVAGTLAADLSVALTSALAGTVEGTQEPGTRTGALDATLPVALSTALTGDVAVSGALAASLPVSLTSALSGAVTAVGTLDATLPVGLAVGLTGSLPVTGGLAAQLPPVALGVDLTGTVHDPFPQRDLTITRTTQHTTSRHTQHATTRTTQHTTRRHHMAETLYVNDPDVAAVFDTTDNLGGLNDFTPTATATRDGIDHEGLTVTWNGDPASTRRFTVDLTTLTEPGDYTIRLVVPDGVDRHAGTVTLT